jgi:hypothetical protein
LLKLPCKSAHNLACAYNISRYATANTLCAVYSTELQYIAIILGLNESCFACYCCYRLRGCDTKRLTTSFAESTVFRKSIKPVSIPAKLWITFKLMQKLPWRNRTSETELDNALDDTLDDGVTPKASTSRRRKSRLPARAQTKQRLSMPTGR